MRKTNFPVLEIVVAAALVTIAFTVVLLLFPAMQSEKVASWVQAIGSIATIAGAFWIGERQANAATKTVLQLQANEIKQKKASVLAIAYAARSHAESIYRSFEQDNDVINVLAIALVFNKRVFSDVIDAIAAVPLHDLGSFQAVDALLKIKEASVYLIEKVERARHPSDLAELYQERPRNVREKKASIRTSCNVVRQEYERLAVALGA